MHIDIFDVDNKSRTFTSCEPVAVSLSIGEYFIVAIDFFFSFYVQSIRWSVWGLLTVNHLNQVRIHLRQLTLEDFIITHLLHAIKKRSLLSTQS